MNNLGNNSLPAAAFSYLILAAGFSYCPAALALRPAMGGHLEFIRINGVELR